MAYQWIIPGVTVRARDANTHLAAILYHGEIGQQDVRGVDMMRHGVRVLEIRAPMRIKR